MKELIRRWLGITNLDNSLSEIKSVLIQGKATIAFNKTIAFIGQVEIVNVKITRSLKSNRAELTLNIKAADLIDELMEVLNDNRS